MWRQRDLEGEVSDVDAGGGSTTEGSAELKVTARFDEDFAMSVLEGSSVNVTIGIVLAGMCIGRANQWWYFDEHRSTIGHHV